MKGTIMKKLFLLCFVCTWFAHVAQAQTTFWNLPAREVPLKQLRDSLFCSDRQKYNVNRYRRDHQWNPKAVTMNVADCIDSVLWENPFLSASEMELLLVKRYPALLAHSPFVMPKVKAVMDGVEATVPNARKEDYWNCILTNHRDLVEQALRIGKRERDMVKTPDSAHMRMYDLLLRRAVMLHFLSPKPGVAPDYLPYLKKLGIGKDQVTLQKVRKMTFNAQ